MKPPHRPRFAYVAILPLMLCAFITARPVLAAAGTRDLPNIVILYADDMGHGDLGVQNAGSKIPTPHLDQLASEGIRFTDAHSSSGICSPSRYALLTGRFHWRKFHGIVNSFGPSVFDKNEFTLPGMLRTKGYTTACIGKWHLGWDWDAIKKPGAKAGKGGFAPNEFDWSKAIPGGPLAHGFDYYFGDDVPNFPPYAWFENDRVITVPTEPLTITPKTAEGSWEARPGPMVKDWDFYNVMPTLTEKAVAWIGKQKGSAKPFFLYVPFTSPHAPIVPTKEFTGKSKAGGYGDFVVQTDWTCGQILNAIDANGFRENTIVIFTADNGPEKYAYDRLRTFEHRSSGELRGLKRDIYEGGHRVPMLVRWPGKVTPGLVSDGIFSQVDFLATLAAIAGAELPAKGADDSLNQLALWKGGNSARTAIVHNTKANHYAVRQGDWVLIDAKTGSITAVPDWFDKANDYADDRHPGGLYNLREDLAQRKNHYADQPKKVEEMQALLKDIRAKGQRANSAIQ
ncbi:MAG: arylsulfatase [Phycisphaeraceae bacterium]